MNRLSRLVGHVFKAAAFHSTFSNLSLSPFVRDQLSSGTWVGEQYEQKLFVI